MSDSPALELSILMPCLNEAETVEICIRKALTFLQTNNVVGEVVIADNGSTDGSQALAEAAGARVVHVEAKGYGNALLAGVKAARGTYVIMGDADDSYSFAELEPFIEKLREGYDLVMGNRFGGTIEDGAMPALHKYIGNPVLSRIGRLFFRVGIRDFHCGLRGFNREALLSLDLHTTGMEFASEVVVKSRLANQRIAEVPTNLYRDGRSRPPHLRSFRDGWRHLRFLLLYSPRWLYLYPGALLATLGFIVGARLTMGPVQIGSIGFDIGTLLYAVASLVIGYQAILFAVLTRFYGERAGLLPPGSLQSRLGWILRTERMLILGLVMMVLGALAALASFLRWRNEGFGSLDASQSIRIAAPATAGLILGSQTILVAFFLGVLQTPSRADRLPSATAPADQLTN